MEPNSQDIHYRVILTPQPDPPNAEPIYTAIGRIIVSWGLFENQLDFGLLGILRTPDAEPIRPRLASGEPMPVAFKQKAKLWRKAFRTIPLLSDYQEPAFLLIGRAVGLAKRRDAIVHGNWNNFRQGDPIAIVGVHFRLKNTRMLMTEHVATEDGFNEIAASIRNLSSETSRFLSFVTRVLPPEDVDISPQ